MITLTGQHYSEGFILEMVQTTLEMEQRKHIVQMLNPTLEKDGDKWCMIWGTMPELYIVGYGETPHAATVAFVNDYYSSKINVVQKVQASVATEAK